MRIKPVSVAQGIAQSLAIRMFEVKVDRQKCTTPSVINQLLPTTVEYCKSCRTKSLRWHRNTQNLLRRKWQVTPMKYAMVTATSGGRNRLNANNMEKSIRATVPP